MHRCAARCCDNNTDSMEQVHQCVQNCSSGLTEAEHFVKQEFSTVQVCIGPAGAFLLVINIFFYEY